MKSANKIRNYALLFAVLEIIGISIYGIVLMVRGRNEIGEEWLAFVGLFVLVAGITFALFQYYLLVGFADLIDNTHKIAYPEIHKEKIEKKESGENSISEKAKISTDKLARNLGTCDVCKKENVSVRKATIKKGDTKQDGYICDECLEKNNVKIV